MFRPSLRLLKKTRGSNSRLTIGVAPKYDQSLKTKPSVSSQGFVPSADAIFKNQDAIFIKSYIENPKIMLDTASCETGLFRIPEFKTAEGLKGFSSIVVDRCELLKAKITKENASPIQVLDSLDQMSNAFCSLLDTCEFIRNVHTDMDLISAADSVVSDVSSYMNTLNTDKSLYLSLVKALENGQGYDEEAINVANLFKHDFELSGINMSEDVKQAYVELSAKIDKLGNLFLRSSKSLNPKIHRFKSKIKDIPGISEPIIRLAAFSQQSLGLTEYELPLTFGSAHQVLQVASCESIRKQVYEVAHSFEEDQRQSLQDLLKTRQEFAQLMGYPTYAHYSLKDKMISNPEKAMSFLENLALQIKDSAMSEYNLLLDLKKKETGSHEAQVFEWDKSYFCKKYRDEIAPASVLEQFAKYYSVGNVFAGLSNLFHSMYGVNFYPAKTQRGEVWADDIYKFHVVHEDEGLLGIVYCDMHGRSGKSGPAAHYTIRCGFSSNSAEQEKMPNVVWGSDDPLLKRNASELDDSCEDYVEIAKMSNLPLTKLDQVPIVVLVCNLPGKTCSLFDIDTIFHEMGHLIHSLLAKSKYQNASGTRCQSDFVEIPSTLMENFARDARVLGKFGERDGIKIPDRILASNIKCFNAFENLELLYLIQNAIFDLRCHGDWKSISSKNTIDEIYNEIQSRISPIVPAAGTSLACQFTHLFGYGSFYYSYPLCRRFSDIIWKMNFAKDPFSRENGSKFRNMVLAPGGSIKGSTILSSYLSVEDPMTLLGSMNNEGI